MTIFRKTEALLLLTSLVFSTNNVSAFHAPLSRQAFIDRASNIQLSMSTKSEEAQNDIFAPLKQFFSNKGETKAAPPAIVNDYDEPIAEAKIILNRAVDSKKEDPELVFKALEDLEQLMR